MDEYFTLNAFQSEEYTVNRSRFIGYAAPVSSSEEAVAFINEIRAKHRDATHNVYAYAVRSPEYSRYSDDAEPQGTAGVPVLEVIKKNNLTDVCLVVTRYFGGILLGAGGLVRAYSHSAALAVQASGIIKMGLCDFFEINCDYSFYSVLLRLLDEFNAVTTESFFGEGVTLRFYLPSNTSPAFQKALTEQSLGKVSAQKTGEKFEKIKI